MLSLSFPHLNSSNPGLCYPVAAYCILLPGNGGNLVMQVSLPQECRKFFLCASPNPSMQLGTRSPITTDWWQKAGLTALPSLGLPVLLSLPPWKQTHCQLGVAQHWACPQMSLQKPPITPPWAASGRAAACTPVCTVSTAGPGRSTGRLCPPEAGRCLRVVAGRSHGDHFTCSAYPGGLQSCRTWQKSRFTGLPQNILIEQV